MTLNWTSCPPDLNPIVHVWEFTKFTSTTPNKYNSIVDSLQICLDGDTQIMISEHLRLHAICSCHYSGKKMHQWLSTDSFFIICEFLSILGKITGSGFPLPLPWFVIQSFLKLIAIPRLLYYSIHSSVDTDSCLSQRY